MNSMEMLIGERLLNMPTKDKGMLEPLKVTKGSFKTVNAVNGNKRKRVFVEVNGYIIEDVYIGMHVNETHLFITHTETGRLVGRIKRADNAGLAMFRYLPLILAYFEFNLENLKSTKATVAGKELKPLGETLQALIKAWEGAALGSMVGSFYADEMRAANLLIKQGMPKEAADTLSELKPMSLKK